jgi:hypothetical protein
MNKENEIGLDSVIGVPVGVSDSTKNDGAFM